MDTAYYIMDVDMLQNPDLFADLYRNLPSDRKKKIDAFRLEKDKYLSLGAGILLQVACRVLSIEGADGSLACNSHGKPFFRDYPKIFFNLSHSGQRVMCVISDTEAGCDVEQIRSVPRPVIRRVFTEDERIFLSDEAEKGKEEIAFFRLWTLKESFLKAVGTGFSISPNSFSIAEVCRGNTELEILGKPCTFLLPELKDEYQYAWCRLGYEKTHRAQGWICSFDEARKAVLYPLHQ